MFNDDGVLGKKADSQRSEPRSSNLSISVGARTGAHPPAPVQAEAQKSPPDLSASGGSKLVVGPNIKMTGVEVTDCDTLIVEGHLEATLDSRLIQVGETGVLAGKASMDVAEIWGRLEGEFTIRQQLIIHPSGRVNGSIRYAKIRVEDGGEISGDISTLSAAAESATRTEPTSIKQASRLR
jgi:cytoskeletal protein CcmA (bactofilin family)